MFSENRIMQNVFQVTLNKAYFSGMQRSIKRSVMILALHFTLVLNNNKYYLHGCVNESLFCNDLVCYKIRLVLSQVTFPAEKYRFDGFPL